ncbi:WD40-repeat-containing domain protein [Chiua virens]|nr:WD40-repeat-containing domain protein [Chiua virens]
MIPTFRYPSPHNTRLRKLRDAPSEDTVGGREYERRLRRQYEQITQPPNGHRKRAKNCIPSVGDLRQGIISVDRLRDANQAAPPKVKSNPLRFHPNPQIPVLLTASADRRLRLFHIDGLTNPHAQTLHIPSLPLTNATFHPSGASILLTGPRPFYYTYDLQSGTAHRSPRGLWGTTFSGPSQTPQDGSMDICAFNPPGDVLAIAGRCGHIHLVDWRSGAAQVVAGLKANAAIRALWWSRAHGATSTLLSLTEDAQVYVWDVAQRKCVKRWQDEGGFGSRIVGGDQRGSYLAIGSNTGLVNVYSEESTVSLGVSKPKALKTLGNLTTNITCLRYNHDAQLLAMASNVKKDQMRLVHLPSLTVFGNWPTTSTPLGHVTAMDFSAGSEYLAIGNNRGRALLYQLRHYGEK